MRRQLRNMGIEFVIRMHIVDSVDRSLKLFCDNKLTILHSNNNRRSTKSKYMDIKYLVVKKLFKSVRLFIEHIDTNSMIAYLLTKGLLHHDVL